MHLQLKNISEYNDFEIRKITEQITPNRLIICYIKNVQKILKRAALHDEEIIL